MSSRSIVRSSESADREMLEALCSGYSSDDLRETMEAEKDILGTQAVPAIVPRDQTFVEESIKGMKEALNRLPVEERQAYEEVVRTNPRLVQVETPFERFLLFCEYNHWAAAEQLARYWEQRKEIFKERFSLPMNLSGEGALSPEIVQVIKTGVMLPLPPDRYNRSVFLMDEEKVTDAFNEPDIKIKIKFYHYQVLSESERANSNGAVMILALCRTGQKFRPDGVAVKFLSSTAIPLKTVGCHLLTLKKPSFFQKTLNSWKIAASNSMSFSMRMRYHYSETAEEISKEMAEFGLNQGHLLQRLGGKANFQDWCRWRIRVEEEQLARIRGDDEDSTSRDRTPNKRASTKPSADLCRKRKLEHFQDWARNHLESQKMQKMERRVQELRKQQEDILQQTSFLEAHLECTKYIEREMEKQKQVIVCTLTLLIESNPRLLLTVNGTSPQTYRERYTLAENFFHQNLLFVGCDPVTSFWLLSPLPELTAEQTQLALVVIEVLASHQQSILLQTNAKPSCLDAPTDQTRVLPNYCYDGNLDNEVLHLQTQIDNLRDTQSELQCKHRFLIAANTSASYLARKFEHFKKENRDLVAQFYSRVFHYLTNMNSDQMLRGPFCNHALADRVLNVHSFFDGQQFVNSIAEIARTYPVPQKPQTAEIPQESLLALLSIYSGIGLTPGCQGMLSRVSPSQANQEKIRNEVESRQANEAARKKYRQERKKQLRRLK